MNTIFYVGWRVTPEFTKRAASIGTFNGVPYETIDSKHHTTVVYSRGFPKGKMTMDIAPNSSVGVITDIEHWTTPDGLEFTVAIVDCDDIKTRHQEFMDAGCSYDFSEYRPHITLAQGGNYVKEYKELIGQHFTYGSEYIQFFTG